jgi:hypothetical protein
VRRAPCGCLALAGLSLAAVSCSPDRCERVYPEPPSGEIRVPASVFDPERAGEVRVLVSSVSLVVVYDDGSVAVYERAAAADGGG